jgi:hypothetical protein
MMHDTLLQKKLALKLKMQKPDFHLHQQKDHGDFLRLLVPELSVLCKGTAVIKNVIECNERIFAFISKRQLKRNTGCGAFDDSLPYSYFL